MAKSQATPSLHAVQTAFDFNNPSTWILDPTQVGASTIASVVDMLEERAKVSSLAGKLPVKFGWNEVTPAIALQLLLRNRPDANRKVDPNTVIYYACQMMADDWKATGQPILIDVDGRLLDGQHRLIAILITGVTLRLNVTTDIESIPQIFAYIDNVRPRTAATALQTAGMNGVSSVIAAVLKLAEEIKAGVYDPASAVLHLARLSPAQILHISEGYPNVKEACRNAASDWEEAVRFLSGGKPKASRRMLVAYLGMKILDAHGEDTANDFFADLCDASIGANTPIGLLRQVIDKDVNPRSTKKPMKKQHVLAALIKVFNAWKAGAASLPKRWMLQVNENLPEVEGGQVQAEAAE